jgi:glutathione S-transferase
VFCSRCPVAVSEGQRVRASGSVSEFFGMTQVNATIGTSLNVVDAQQFPNVAAWKAKIEARPAYQRMRAKALPNGMVGAPPALPQHAPAGPRNATPPSQ